MASMLNSTETPNLLELVEAYRGFRRDMIDLSLCSDEGPNLTISVCADEGPPADHSIGGVEGSDLPSDLLDLSLCADEGTDSGASDVRLKTDIEQVGTTVYGCRSITSAT